MLKFAVRVVLFECVDLNRRVLSVDLAFDEVLQVFWHPDIKTDEFVDGGDLETDVFLEPARHAQLALVTQNTVQAGEQLLCRELFLVVGTRNLKCQ